MNLRLTEGLSLSRYQNITGKPVNQDALDELIDGGAIIQHDDHIFVEKQYLSLLNQIIFKLLEA